MRRETTVAVLLAGGEARRMGGGDKCLKTLRGTTLLELAIGRIGPQVAAMVLNANGDPARFAAFGLPVAADSVPDYPGPLAGVLAGLDWARANVADATHVVSVATDTPFLPRDLVARLAAAMERTPAPLACAASAGRVHPVIGLWPVSLAEDLRASIASGMRKIDRWTALHGIAVAHFDASGGDPFFNINTEGDLARAEELAA